MVSDNEDLFNDVKDIKRLSHKAIDMLEEAKRKDKDKAEVEPDLDEDGNMITVHWSKLQTNPYSAHKLFGDAIKSESGVRRLAKCKLKGEAKKNSVAPSKMRQVIFDKTWAIAKTVLQLEGLLSSFTEDEFIKFMKEVYEHYHSKKK
ncbi:hypothetical protein M595_5119 [Lyngbya aestuarii BL J]|uniref:Uncharacterized protein n=1 Tax=Lyngbya aestuarii BL J TaxID=1348334 RepID=U7QCL8_9CYAN|nr:hypothetical protein [Lyngbya aestuarii]ERT04927.1 hypothetical protein M595_5119 [Lyngbya aestuarii BL J]